MKDDAAYEALRKQGASEQKAAQIGNAKAAGTLHHRGTTLEDRGKSDLMKEACEIGVAGRRTMSKADLVKAIRKD